MIWVNKIRHEQGTLTLGPWLWCAKFVVSISLQRDLCLAHLGQICEGTKQPQIDKCTNVPMTTKALFHICGGNFPRTNVEDEVHITLPMHQNDAIGSQGQGSCTPMLEICDQINLGKFNTPTQSMRMVNQNLCQPLLGQQTRQISSYEGLNILQGQVVDKKWANVFCEYSVAFNLA